MHALQGGVLSRAILVHCQGRGSFLLFAPFEKSFCAGATTVVRL
jgi:hypothetical protein